ncbi:MAG: hypothetical protein MUF81_13735 [Verrucomicrobia bacterium]|nr:hypothetical protein [Verrucomicrobiota bacterium]
MPTLKKTADGAAEAQTLFKKHFSYTPPHVVKAPGRLEVLGNHTDYNDGVVLSVAVDKYIFIASAPRTDGKIELVSSAFPEPEKFWMSEIKSNPAARWADYVKGVLAQLRKRGVHFSGFNAAIYGTIPMGAGIQGRVAPAAAHRADALRQTVPRRGKRIRRCALRNSRSSVLVVRQGVERDEH